MQDDSANGKKAVHVKWAGKTIALGTFVSAEADEKCARAKALTRAWRSTMRPKPTREWVMVELERLGVRIVSGKLGRKPDFDQDSEPVEGGGLKRKAAAAASSEGRDTIVEAQERMVQQRTDSGMGMSNGGLGGIPPASSGQQVNQHYEMLKLHHMNLLQELHETTMMMNMYQQQQLQASQSVDPILRRGSLGMGIFSGGQRGSLGLGNFGSRGSLGNSSGVGTSFGHRGSLGLGGSSLGGLQSSFQLGGHKDDDTDERKQDSIGHSNEGVNRFKADGDGEF